MLYGQHMLDGYKTCTRWWAGFVFVLFFVFLRNQSWVEREGGINLGGTGEGLGMIKISCIRLKELVFKKKKKREGNKQTKIIQITPCCGNCSELLTYAVGQWVQGTRLSLCLGIGLQLAAPTD